MILWEFLIIVGVRELSIRLVYAVLVVEDDTCSSSVFWFDHCFVVDLRGFDNVQIFKQKELL